MNLKTAHVVALFVPVVLASAAPAKPQAASSRVESVTVYRGQAQVTRAVSVPAVAGELELIVGDLPSQVIGNSLHASGPTGVTIRSVQFRSQAVAEEPLKEVAELDAQIKALNRQIFDNGQRLAVLTARNAYADKLEAFAAPTAKVELTQGVLNAETLGKVTEQLFAIRSETAEQTIRITHETEDLQEKLALVQRKRAELTRESGKAVREAVIFLTAEGKQAQTLHLSYLVGSANWSPAYNIRLAEGGNVAEVEYLAQVQQMTGEDWNAVKLSLSTATPLMNAKSPPLVPLWVDLFGESGGKKGLLSSLDKAKNPSDYALSQETVSQSQYSALNVWAAAGKREEVADAGWDLNRNAAERQRLELNVEGEVIRKLHSWKLEPAEEGLAVSYALGGSMTLASRSDSQLVQVAKLTLPAETYYQAIPLLTGYVYQAAEVTNKSDLPLLAGPYSAYIGGEFVGRGDLYLVARGQKATVGFGVDTQLRCSRELVDKSDTISWGSRIQKFTYRLRMENFKDAPVTVRLFDRIPASKSEDVKVTLGKLSAPLSTDPLYLRDLRDRGVLRWDIPLAGEATGLKATDATYEFEMRFAKDAHVGKFVGEASPAMEVEFRDMMLKH